MEKCSTCSRFSDVQFLTPFPSQPELVVCSGLFPRRSRIDNSMGVGQHPAEYTSLRGERLVGVGCGGGGGTWERRRNERMLLLDSQGRDPGSVLLVTL